MTTVAGIDSNDLMKPTYNSVKIKVNNPKTNVSGKTNNLSDIGEYNGVNIEINDPEVNAGKKRGMYDYPQAKEIVTYDKSGFAPIDLPDMPLLPVSYKTSFISNRTFINADVPQNTPEELPAEKTENPEEVPVLVESYSIVEELPVEETKSEPEIIEIKEDDTVPPPNVTTTEDEKLENSEEVTFHGVNFKSAEPQIIKDGNLESAIDVDTVVKNLTSSDFDIQAKQMNEIAQTTANEPNKAVPYINTAIFSSLADIISKDTSKLEGPTDRQTEIRKQIILNELMKEKQLSEGKKIEEIEIPYQLSDEDMALAIKLSPMELAERNKEYGILTLAILSKLYTEEFEKSTGNQLAITDLPEINSIVNVLKESDVPSLKMSSIAALMYIRKPQFNPEIKSILEVAAQDNNAETAHFAKLALDEINKPQED